MRQRTIERHAGMDTGVLTCPHCGDTKTLSEFTPTPNRPLLRYQSWCRSCSRVAQNASHQKHPSTQRDTYLRRTYGISLDEYDALVTEQGGVCAICGGVETRSYGRKGVTALAVDHNHVTGAVRSLLCHRCNVMVGFIERQPQILARVTAYLRMEE